MRLSPLLGASAMLCLAAGPALPQADQNGRQLPIATVTCGDIAGVPAPYQAALIFYAAGYRDGVDYARAAGSIPATAANSLPTSPVMSSQLTVASAPDAASAASASSSEAVKPAEGSHIVGGLVLQPQDVLAACAAAPQAFLTDIIANHGGARGPQGSPSAAPGTPMNIAPPSNSAAPPATSSAAAPAASPSVPGATDNGSSAVSADLGAAGQQLQQNLSPSAVPGATAPTPGAQATPGAATSP